MPRSTASRAARGRRSKKEIRRETRVSNSLTPVSGQNTSPAPAPTPEELSMAIPRSRNARALTLRFKNTAERPIGTRLAAESVGRSARQGTSPSGLLEFTDKYLTTATQSFRGATRLLYPLTGMVILGVVLICGVVFAGALFISIVMVVEDHTGVSPWPATYLVLSLGGLGLTGRIWLKDRRRAKEEMRSER